MCGAIRQTDGRHTGGGAQRGISMPYLYCPSKDWMSEHVQGRRSILFIVHDAGTDQRETGITVWPENLAGIKFGGLALKGCELYLAD